MNSQKDLNLIISRIENEACYNNPGPAAESAVKWVDEEYVLIPRETLPVVEHPSLDDALGGDTTVRLKNITETAFGGDYKKMRDLGLQYLVMADHIENKVQKEVESKLRLERFRAYNLIHPNNVSSIDNVNFDSLSTTDKNAINVILDLKAQLAKAQEKK